jgi:hypothetical protein
MAYADLIDDEGIKRQFLAVLKPRRIVDSFTLYAGSVYYKSFDFGEVVRVEVDGTALVQSSSVSLAAGEFYYDVPNQLLYVRTSGSDDPDTHFVTATYELYFGTFDAHWHRVPTDTATREVYFEPMIVQSPQLISSVSDQLSGFMPVHTTQIVLSNATHLFEKHVYDSSFSEAEIRLYHWLGNKLAVADMKEVFIGVCDDVSYSDQRITIKVFSPLDRFMVEYRHAGTDKSFFATSDFPNLDPKFQGRPIRAIYGMVDGFVPVNIDYLADAPTTSDNRDWVTHNGQGSENSRTTTVPASPASTATRTYLTSAQGFQVGDSVWLDRVVGVDEYKIVTAVSYSPTPYIEHTALSGGAMASGDSVKRSYVGIVDIVQASVKYRALYGRDYTEASFAGGTIGFSFATTLEANLSMPSTLSPNDRVSARVYGKKNDVTLGGPAFGTDDSEVGGLTNPVVIVFDILKSKLGLTESEINTSSFTTALAAVSERIGFAIPEKSSEQFPTFKDLIVRIMGSSLLSLFQDNDNKWKIEVLAPLPGSPDYTITDEEIAPRGQFSYEFSYGDVISEVFVEYAMREIAEEVSISEPTVRSVSVSSDTARLLHKIKKQKTFKSYHLREDDATTLATHLSYALGDRSGSAVIQTKPQFFSTIVNQTLRVTRTRMPGFDYDKDVSQSRDFSVSQVKRGLNSVTIEVDDQKGIEDNGGTW